MADSSKEPLQIPFDERGNLLEYAGSWRSKMITWKENYTFEATLTYGDFYRGRSAVRINWVDDQQHVYGMFLKDLTHVLKLGVEPGAKITATWTFVKRGSNYGITPAEAPKERRTQPAYYVSPMPYSHEPLEEIRARELHYAKRVGKVVGETDRQTFEAYAFEPWTPTKRYRWYHKDYMHGKDNPPRYISCIRRTADDPERYLEIEWTPEPPKSRQRKAKSA